MRDIDLCKGFFNLLKDLESAFGGGQGRLLDREMADAMGHRFLTGQVPGGTREFCYLAGTPARLLAKLPNYLRCAQVRLAHAEDGRGGHNREWWTSLGRSLASIPMIVLACCRSVCEGGAIARGSPKHARRGQGVDVDILVVAAGLLGRRRVVPWHLGTCPPLPFRPPAEAFSFDLALA